MSKAVALVKVEDQDVDEAVFRAICMAGGLEERIRAATRVLVKPNVCGPHPSGSGAVTDARVTRAVVRFVMECDARSVVIGEGAGAGYDFSGAHSTEECFRVSGTKAVAEELGVDLRNLNTEPSVEVNLSESYVMNPVKIARTAYESDLVISLPVFKTHKRTVTTLSLKNMKGVMPGAEKRRTHRLGLDLGIADLVTACPPGYVVADGIVGLGGTWQFPDDSVPLGLVMAGPDPIAADAIGTAVMGFDPSKVMHLQYYARRVGCTVDPAAVEVRGESTSGWPRFRGAFETFQERFPQVQILEGKSACSGCSGELIGALSYIRMAELADRLEGLTILMGCTKDKDISAGGETSRPEDRTLHLGKCCREAGLRATRGAGSTSSGTVHGKSAFTPGCPPKSESIIRDLAGLCGFDGLSVLELCNAERRRLWDTTAELLSS